MRRTLFPTAACLFILLLFLSACRPPGSQTQTLVGYNVVNLHRVAVMPFLAGNANLDADEQVKPAIDCTLREFCQTVNEDLGAGAETVLTREMQRAMELKLYDKVVPLTDAAAIYDRLPQNRLVDTPRQLAQRFGRAAGADHVLLGSVWRYRDRTPDMGASVAFTVYLLQVDNGRRVWRGRFDKTQHALTDDLQDASLFFRGGARWLSAEELARLGVAQVMQVFPKTAE